MDEKRDNTTLTVIIVIGIILIVGVVAYFIYANTKANDKVDEPTVSENDKVKDEAEDIDVVGAYSGEYTATDDNEKTTTGTIELVLDEDGKAKIVKSLTSEDVLTGTYVVNTKKITVTVDKKTTDTAGTNTTGTDTTGTNNKTNKVEENTVYEFTVNSDDSLTYTDTKTTKTVKMKKDKLDNLKFIK